MVRRPRQAQFGAKSGNPASVLPFAPAGQRYRRPAPRLDRRPCAFTGA
jgi:hypothetical protein